MLQKKARGGAMGVLEDRGTLGDLGLGKDAFGHGPANPLEDGGDVFADGGIFA